EILDAYQVTIPELGTMTATTTPLVVLTSNNTRELSEALKRRCLYLNVPYPTIERERAILSSRVPELDRQMAERIAATVAAIRAVPVRKAPSVSESIDWARTLLALEVESVSDDVLAETLHVLLKYQTDIDKVTKELSLDTGTS
ncbi:MAG: MoxR family ATPase, partial [Acidimicrobiia bacterium]|nr:MoxR family ATPase [Acidimicrobiia bacterium]